MQDRFVTLDGLRLHYCDWGGAHLPPLIALHGGGGHAREWDMVAAALSRHYRVLALDQRGHGESDRASDYGVERLAADLAACVNALDLAPVTLIGHSRGGTTALVYAAGSPATVERLVLVDLGPDTWENHRRMVEARPPPPLPLVFADPEEAVAVAGARNRRLPESQARRVTLPNLVQRPDGLWSWRTDPAARDAATAHAGLSVDAYWAMLPRITCPTLIVRGAHSRLLTPETAARMLEELPDGRLVEVPESSHMVHQENPEGFIAAVRPFLIGGV